jgi:hypothetical protein
VIESFKCPSGNHQAIKTWYVFVGFSPLWLFRRCMRCGTQFRLNYNTIGLLLITSTCGIIVGSLINGMIGRHSTIVEAGSMLIFISIALYPIIIGKPLFTSVEKEDDKKILL